MKTTNIIVAFLGILLFSNCAAIYKAPDLSNHISNHKKIAFLPFDAVLQYARPPRNVTLEQILAVLEVDAEILLTKGNVPIAHIAAASLKSPRITARTLDLHEGQAWMSEDFTDELPASFWLGDDG